MHSLIHCIPDNFMLPREHVQSLGPFHAVASFCGIFLTTYLHRFNCEKLEESKRLILSPVTLAVLRLAYRKRQWSVVEQELLLSQHTHTHKHRGQPRTWLSAHTCGL